MRTFAYPPGNYDYRLDGDGADDTVVLLLVLSSASPRPRIVENVRQRRDSSGRSVVALTETIDDVGGGKDRWIACDCVVAISISVPPLTSGSDEPYLSGDSVPHPCVLYRLSP